MSVKTTTVYNCDYCQKQLPDDYATTNGEGKGYYVKKAHDTIPLDTPIAGCTGIVVEVTLGTPKDDHHFTDLCDDCRLKFLKMAVEHLERKVAAEKEGLNNDGEETDQKKFLRANRLDPFNWLVQKDTPEFMQIIHKYSDTVRKIKKKVTV